MGVYPYLCCRNSREVGSDLASLRNRFVTVTLVTDPFGGYEESWLREHFDLVTAFKSHFVVDTTLPLEEFSSVTHRKFARRAQRQLTIERCAEPSEMLQIWLELYQCLIERHQIKGMRAFSREAFRRQLTTPGMVMFAARQNNETVALDLWYVQGDVAHGHLAAMNARGYETHAAYGLKLAIFEYFRGKVRWLNLGGGAGLDANAGDGLTAFKRGWASGTRMAWLCGRILQPQRYQQINHELQLPTTRYFPAYRQGEFA